MTQNTAAAIWKDSCKQLRDLLHPDVYARWISVIEPQAYTDDTLTLAVDNDFYQTWLEENYQALIRTSVSSTTGQLIEIRFVVVPKGDAVKPKTTRKRSAKKKKEEPRPPPPLNPKFTFDEFIIGPSNHFAHAATLAVAQAPSRAYNPLFIYGGVGLGKTHLMQAIGHYVYVGSQATVSYLSSESFTNEYINALQNRTLVDFRQKYRNVDLLLIDDIHFLASKERLQEEFFHTFNALSDAHKQIVLTSDRPASEITGLEQRLVSRFEWGLVTELTPPDIETRIAIIRNKLRSSGGSLSDDVVMYIARHITSNIRRLEGALIRVISYASLTGQALELPDVERLLHDTVDQERQNAISFDKIQRAVAEFYDVRIADMTSKRRPQAIAFPRQVAMFLCRRLTTSSLPEIAIAFSKTHATILHAYNTVDRRMKSDTSLRQSVSTIAKKLGASL